ncbi:MarR family winged helix-turn-helix transcriptional regulator [Undibacterium sp. Ren11W]|uniref:MarR family winged helix-turn-helix transcriptional regulator n=1 Tax=Undibacterium sp. Ren11W TaxID=3413045 RepID=UPI003BF32ED3
MANTQKIIPVPDSRNGEVSVADLAEHLSSGEFYFPGNCKPEETIGYLVKTLHLSMLKTIDVEMQVHGLTAMQWRPLWLISQGKGETAAVLAKEMNMDTGAVTRMLDRLQAKDLLVRKRCEQDRRVVHLELTEEGLGICAQIPTGLCAAINHHLRGFSNDEFETLKRLLQQMISNGLSL